MKTFIIVFVAFLSSIALSQVLDKPIWNGEPIIGWQTPQPVLISHTITDSTVIFLYKEHHPATLIYPSLPPGDNSFTRIYKEIYRAKDNKIYLAQKIEGRIQPAHTTPEQYIFEE